MQRDGNDRRGGELLAQRPAERGAAPGDRVVDHQVRVDVRELFEWDEGHIEGALHVPMGEALARKDLVPDGRPKAVLCAGGLRSSTVISALARAGLTDWYNVIGGMTAWQEGGYSTVKRSAP